MMVKVARFRIEKTMRSLDIRCIRSGKGGDKKPKSGDKDKKSGDKKGSDKSKKSQAPKSK